MDVIICKELSKRYAVYSSPRSYLKELLTFKTRRYHKEFTALQDVDFVVSKGESVGIIGRNGAGKSTLLKILAGTTIPTSGEVFTDGKVSALLELGAGFDFEFSGRRNIYLNGTILGYSRGEMDRKFEEIVSFSELGDYIDMPIKTYSSGMVIRLGFSIAIHTDPDILLVDEVLAVGDIAFQKKCIRKLNHMRRDGRTIILVSHSLGDLGGFCDRVILLSDGRILSDGDTEMVIKRYIAETEEKSGQNLSSRFDIIGNEDTKFEKRTGEIEIRSVTIRDGSGRQIDSIRTGNKLQIVIDYQAHRQLENPLIRISFFRGDGLFVHGTNTYRQGLDLGMVDGPGRVTLSYDHFELLENTYFITVEICRDEFSSSLAGRTYDCHNMKYALEVKSNRTDGGGIVRNPNVWTVTDGK